MNGTAPHKSEHLAGLSGNSGGVAIRVRGLVQGVGFRPSVWRLAYECGLAGFVLNDGGGVLIHAWGDTSKLEAFLAKLRTDIPPLARIDSLDCELLEAMAPSDDFVIRKSDTGEVQTGIVPDAATCPACQSEIFDPQDRHHRYAFTNCTHCGPRLSIIKSIPYDRANTAMSPFEMCPACRAEYDDPADRRFHAQPNACPECGPQLWLEDKAGNRIKPDKGGDVVRTAQLLLSEGHIIAVKGIGGFHLACDAANEEAVSRLRKRKRRYDKPFALMAAQPDMISQYADVDEKEHKLLEHAAAPIVVLDIKRRAKHLAAGVAPGQSTLGFMLPYTPLHHLLMDGLQTPLVMTSGNRSDEPQCISNRDARAQLSDIADYWLMHDREIVNRLDDSVARIADGQTSMLRRARGYAPSPINLPAGFEDAPRVLAMGAELKNTFCLIRQGQAIVSQHMGDLEDAATHSEYRNGLKLYRELFEFDPELISVDMHPGYHSTQWGMALAAEDSLKLDEVQHHHAHIASCMAEHGLPLETGPVLGIALDGLGLGDDGQLWGGEFLIADYAGFERVARFVPVPMPGGDKASREPWRNTFAHLSAAFGWDQAATEYADLDIIRHLQQKPVPQLRAMIERGLNAPLASSAGRLFDAAAAAIGIGRDGVSYEGQAAVEMEALASRGDLQGAGSYSAGLDDADGMLTLQWQNLWRGLLEDLRRGTDTGQIAARFHNSVAEAVGLAALRRANSKAVATIILTGGVFQNRLLLRSVSRYLRANGLTVLCPSQLPANDGGVALGQAVISAARQLRGTDS